MALPTLAEARTFFESDIFIETIPDARINYWISDISAKGIISAQDWEALYFNGFMNLLGHYLYVYETNNVSSSGAIVSSETTSKISRSWAVSDDTDPFSSMFKTTKYGRIYLQLRSQLAVVGGGLVTYGGACV